MTRDSLDATVGPRSIDNGWLVRARGEYLEMPGLSLTLCQAQRLWGLAPKVSEAILDALVQVGFLRQTTHGRYVRADVA